MSQFRFIGNEKEDDICRPLFRYPVSFLANIRHQDYANLRINQLTDLIS